jgi:uncharacterized membrane protein
MKTSRANEDIGRVFASTQGEASGVSLWGAVDFSKERRMEDLIVITYPSEARAEEMRKKILSLQSEYLIELGDAVIAVKQEDGHVKLNQLIHTTAAGAATGALWGALIGAIFLMPLAGAALGAGAGALSGALTDIGIDDNVAKQIASGLKPGDAALFLLVRKMTTDKVLDALKGTGGVVLKTSLDRQKEQALRDALAGASSATAAGA